MLGKKSSCKKNHLRTKNVFEEEEEKKRIKPLKNERSNPKREVQDLKD